jgi:hypothetical protein
MSPRSSIYRGKHRDISFAGRQIAPRYAEDLRALHLIAGTRQDAATRDPSRGVLLNKFLSMTDHWGIVQLKGGRFHLSGGSRDFY